MSRNRSSVGLVSNIVRGTFVWGCGVAKAGGGWRVMLMTEGEDEDEGGDWCGEWVGGEDEDKDKDEDVYVVTIGIVGGKG